jgi:tRNA threonylcarbamoyladenosine biosynthesis protein TsaB
MNFNTSSTSSASPSAIASPSANVSNASSTAANRQSTAQSQLAQNYANILCIAASTSQCSLLLKTPTDSYAWRSDTVNQHSEQLLPAVAELLAKAGLSQPDLIAVDIGPGAFTSVRVACGVAQGLALGWDCPVLGVQSLTALAYQALAINKRLGNVTCVIDARMNECYVAKYGQIYSALKQTSPPRLVPYEAIKGLNTDTVIGNALLVVPQWRFLSNETSASCMVIDESPSAQGVLAAALAALHDGAKTDSAETLQPLYVRDQVALTTEQRLAGKPI